MASKEAPKADAAAAPAPKKSKKMLILAVLVVVILAVAGGAAFLLLGKKKAAADEEPEEAAHATHEWPKYDPSKPPVFMPLEPFTVNLQPENGEQFLQLVSSVRVIDAHVGDTVKSYMPQIRHEVLTLLSGKKASEITTPEGREALAEEMKEIMNEVLGWEPPPKKKSAKGKGKEEEATGPVVAVFFTQFIVQ
ncbi:flagellar basal body-associated protein FliL [Uliginosibacterium paludis]|uniref:Flagellar protein FliL n=1 Tax=Uliginosibacterium paludis TaxID=1615952 RepID=A0ABV2CKZ6_9RHOO